MRFASGISDAVNAEAAVDAACRQAAEQLAGVPCHLAWLFVSPVYRAAWGDLARRVREALQPGLLLGCSGNGLIGGGQEFEWVPAVSVFAAHLPGVRFYPFTIAPDEVEEAPPGGFWIDKIGAPPDANPIFIMLSDPYTTPTPAIVQALNATYRNRPIIGGLVSGGNAAGDHLLFHQDQVLREGAVGVALTGNVAMDTVVSQGCRPIGRPYVVTQAEDTTLWRLGGRQALAVLHEVLSGLSAEDRDLAQRGSIFVGLAMNEMRQSFGSGDFLIRNIVGIDPDRGGIAVATGIEVGQTLQFQLRDPAASRQELRRLLQDCQSRQVLPPAGGLLFNCTGRGRALYGSSHQDVRTIQVIGGKFPVGGFFCNGEIGPVGGTNFVHGYTASLGLFRPQNLSTPAPQPGKLGQAT
jgi:small ligand-binding sensory domain FIST